MDPQPGASGPDSPTGPIRATPPPGRRRRLTILIALGLLIVVGAVAAIVASRPDPGSGGSSGSLPSDGMGTDVPITVEGDQIMRNGQPWWLLGYNSFVWSGDCGDEEERMSAEDVDAWFSSMRHDGHGSVRLFFFDGWNLDRLDAAVESAKRNEIYLTITLDDAIGGCGETEKNEEWYADQDERDTFQAHMTMLLERYRGETTIAWFEYFNEPDFADGQLREFYDEMGAVADEIDPDRLFASGTIAPYSAGGDAAFRTLHESPGVDIASLHEYDESEVESNHGPDTIANSAGKPVIVGEFGLYASESGEDCERDFAERAEQAAAKIQVYTSAEGYVGAQMWAWQPGPDNASECEYGNLDVDEATQDVLRTFTP
ncbi:MAG: glycoside hydrolase family 5 protein [Pseudonocardia sp.]|nr:glycoside hydrolase family 5 protein [Pseudonocardia sp.]